MKWWSPIDGDEKVAFTPIPEDDEIPEQDFEWEQQRYDIESAKNTYNVSDLVLKLDAIDNPLVVEYDEKREKQAAWRKSSIAKQQLKEELHTRLHRKDWWTSEDKSLPALRAKAATIPSSSDILALTLLGNPYRRKTSGTRSSTLLRAIMLENDIRDTELPPRKMFNNMLENMTSASTERAGSVPEANLLQHVLRSNSLWELQRLTDQLSQTYEGCQLLVDHSSDLVAALARLRSGASTTDILVFLNNLIVCIEKREVEMGKTLCHFALMLSVEARTLAGTRNHLHTSLTRNYTSTGMLYTAMSIFITKSVSSISPWKRVDAMRLMTGWEHAGIPDPGETRQPSFALCVGDNMVMWKAYIEDLGRLGASEALWNEFKNQSLPLPAHDATSTKSRLRLTTFLRAFFAAGDLRSAIKCLPTGDSAVGKSMLRDMNRTHNLDLTSQQFDNIMKDQLSSCYIDFSKERYIGFRHQHLLQVFGDIARMHYSNDRLVSEVEQAFHMSDMMDIDRQHAEFGRA